MDCSTKDDLMGSKQSVEMPGDKTVEEPAVGLQDAAQEAAALRLAEVAGPEKAQSRELRALYGKRGPQALETSGSGEPRSTRSRSRTPAVEARPPVKVPQKRPASAQIVTPEIPAPERRPPSAQVTVDVHGGALSGIPISGQMGLAAHDGALVAEDKSTELMATKDAAPAMTRPAKRARKAVAEAPGPAAMAAEVAGPSARAVEVNPMSNDACTSTEADKGQDAVALYVGRGAIGLKAVPPRKRVRRVPTAASEVVDLGDWAAEDGDDDSDGSAWEPDWKSEDDEDDTLDLTQEEEGLEAEEGEDGLLALKNGSDDELLDVPLGQRQQSAKPKKGKKLRGGQQGRDAIAAAMQDAAEAKQGGKSKAKGKGKGKGKAEAKEEKADSGDDVWGPFSSDTEEITPVKREPMKQMEAPPELLMELLPYQKEFLAWAIKQERGSIRGGILADEMGMGKTIQAISVIVTHRTDDNSKLPPLIPADAPKTEPQSDTSGKRPKLRLRSAPALPTGGVEHGVPAAAEEAAVEAGKGEGDDDWEDVPEEHLAKEDTVVPELAADNGGTPPAGLGSAPSAEGPDATLPPSHDKRHLHEVHAVGGGGACCSDEPSTSAAAGGNYCRATLVVCPLVAVIQWRQEIARYTTPHTLKVVVHHGNKRSLDPAELENADVVLTTYSIIEGEFRRFSQPNKVTCTYCNKKYYPDRLKVHLRFFCGPNAKKSAALAKQQKKRPRAQEAADSDSDDSDFEAEDADSDSDDEGPKKPPAKKRAGGKKPGTAKGKGKGAKKEDGAKGKGKGPSKIGAKAAAADEDGEEDLGAVKKGRGAKGTSAKGKGKAPAKGKGKEKASSKAKAKARAVSDSDDDPDFEDSEAESSESEEEGPSGRMRRPKFVNNGSGWESRAMAEAEAMIAASQGKSARGGEAGKSILHEVKWRRIILDEAHSIKDRRCSTAKAVFALESKYKWALSGTPLQNRVGELYSLVRFLAVYPWSFYFCNKKTPSKPKKGEVVVRCECKSLDYSFRTNWRQCDHCGHSPLVHYCWWNKYVANPIKKFGYQGKGRAAMRLLKEEILQKILLRRTKVQCADVLALPPRTVVLRKDRFDERELDFYEALYTQSQAQFGAYIEAGVVVNNYAHIFDLLIRLRQAVDHPYLVVHSSTAPGAGAAAKEAEQRDGTCNICHDPLEDGVAAGCGHAFCRACISDFMETAVSASCCPACERPLTIDLTNAASAKSSRVAGSKKGSIINRISLADFQSSTKIEAIREELERMMQRDPSGKAIVFSQFTSMLDLIAFRLQQVGIKCVRLEGSQAMAQRDRMIESFTNDPSVRVFLMSLKAGGVALNLTAASHVMLTDPWWNPAVEQQAQDRIHRLGQYKPIHVTRFVIGGTIEERILKLQEKKQLVFEGTVGRDLEALGRLTEDDLRFLFA